MKIRRIIFLAIFLAVSTAYVLSPGAQSVSYQIITIGVALIALYTSRIYGFNSANGRTHLLITGGLVCWAVAEIIWYVLKHIMGVDPFPSIADVFFLLAYPLFAAGIYQGFITAEVKLKQVKQPLLAIVLSASFILTILVGYFGIYQAYDPSADILTNIVNLGYGLADLVLVISSLLTILVASEYGGGKLASFWNTITLVFILFLISDILFAMYINLYREDMSPYIYIDLIWIAAYILLAYGMLENYIHVSKIQKNIKLQLLQR